MNTGERLSADLRIDVHSDGDNLVLTVVGEIDLSTASELESVALKHLVADAPRTITLDLSGVTLLSAAGVTALLRITQSAYRRGTTLRLVASAAVRRTLAVLNLTWPFDLAPPAPDPGGATGVRGRTRFGRGFARPVSSSASQRLNRSAAGRRSPPTPPARGPGR